MKSYISRFLHHTLSHSGIREVFTSPLSLSDLIGESRSNKVANLSHLDYRVKPDNDSVCTGRSMVEMLGVLAIIGVLSVGAIAGYGKAMMKYKLNKQAEQLNTIVNAVARNIHSFNDIRKKGVYMTITSFFIKLGEIPAEMLRNGDVDSVYDIFNTQYYVSFEPRNDWIILYMYPPLATKSEQNLNICRNMITTIKENADNISYLQTLHGDGSDNWEMVSYRGDKYCNDGAFCIRKMTLDDIYDMCTKHIGKEHTHMKIGWYL